MTRPRSMLATAIAVLTLGSLGSGLAALSAMANSPKLPSFGMLYGGSPRSTGNGGNGKGTPASRRRVARKRANARARAPKKSAQRRANIGARRAARRSAR
jgi:hypothetical protein